MKYFLPIAALVLLAGCPKDDAIDPVDTDTPTETTGLEIVGDYTDNFGGSHTITDTVWTQDGGLYNITQYDNDGDFLVAQNDSTNGFAPDMWSRFDWHDDGTDLWYCQSAFEAASEEDAANTPPADATDPSTSGCGGFSWSQLIAN